MISKVMAIVYPSVQCIGMLIIHFSKCTMSKQWLVRLRGALISILQTRMSSLQISYAVTSKDFT